MHRGKFTDDDKEAALSREARNDIALCVKGRADADCLKSIAPFLAALEEGLRRYVRARRKSEEVLRWRARSRRKSIEPSLGEEDDELCLYIRGVGSYTLKLFCDAIDALQEPLQDLLSRIEELPCKHRAIHVELMQELVREGSNAEAVFIHLLLLDKALRNLYQRAKDELPGNPTRTPNNAKYSLALEVARKLNELLGIEPTARRERDSPYELVLTVVLREAARLTNAKRAGDSAESVHKLAVRVLHEFRRVPQVIVEMESTTTIGCEPFPQ